jgi:uncharacterized protein YuzE
VKLHYDPSVDALYLRFADAAVKESEEVRPGIVLDYDEANRVVAVEVLNLRKQFPDADVRRLQLELAS